MTPLTDRRWFELVPKPNPDMNPKHTRHLRKTERTHGMSLLNLYYLNILTANYLYVKNVAKFAFEK